MTSPELSEKLQDQNESVVIAALSETCELDESKISPAIVDQVIACLLHADVQVSVQALETVQHLAQTSLDLPRSRILNAPTFLAKSSETPRVRGESAIALVLVDDPASTETITVLTKLLEDNHPRVRQEAAAALGDSSSQRAIPALIEHLTDSDEQTRFECSFALASLKDARGLPLLLESLQSSKRRIDALEGIRRLGESSALSVLEPLSRKFFLGWPERLTVFATMYAIGDKTVVPKIVEKGHSRNKAEKGLAIGLMGTHKIVEAVDFLAETILGSEDSFAIQAIDALGLINTAEAKKVLQQVVANDVLSSACIEAAKTTLEEH